MRIVTRWVNCENSYKVGEVNCENCYKVGDL